VTTRQPGSRPPSSPGCARIWRRDGELRLVRATARQQADHINYLERQLAELAEVARTLARELDDAHAQIHHMGEALRNVAVERSAGPRPARAGQRAGDDR
jgi:hypothetical protein